MLLALMLILSAVSAGFVSAETVAPTYEVFGDNVNYDLTGGLAVADTTLENGAAIITNSTATQKKITLGTDIQDFKISFKFQNGNITDTSGNIEPVLVKMRGKYVFTNPKYNVAAGDIYFAGGGETERRIQGGGSTGWHNVEITMKGSKVVIIYDGIRWYETDLIAGTTSGELSVSLKYENTQIADLKVEAPTDYDVARVVNADFSTAKNTKFPVPGTFSAEESALAVTATQQSYTLGSSDEYNTVYNYTLESTFKLDGVTTEAYQRGVIFNLPTGNAVALFTDKIRTATSNDYLYNKDFFTEIAANIQDGKYHTVKIESVNDTESVFVDGERVYTFTDVVRTTGKAKYQNAIQNGTVYLKNIVLTEYVAPTVEGAPTYEVFGETKNYDFSSGLVFDGDTLENGSGIVTNLTNDDRVIELAENVKDFKLSYKFKNGDQIAGDEYTIWAPVMARMRETDGGAYAFAGALWQYYDITFMYHLGGKDNDEGHRDQYGGWTSTDTDNQWHTVEIMMKGDRAVILYDGMRWHDDTVKRTDSGKLSIRLRYANTKIADLKVEEVTDVDMEKVVDINFETKASSKFPLWYNDNFSAVSSTLNSEDKALNIASTDGNFTLIGGNWSATNETEVENYTFETTYKLDGITDANLEYQRGFVIKLPSGYSVGVFGTQIRSALHENIVGKGSAYFSYKSVTNMDGNYHTIKIVSKNGKESIYYDGALWKTYDIETGCKGSIIWDNMRPAGSTLAVKSIKLVDTANVEASEIVPTYDSEGNVVAETTPFFDKTSYSDWTYEKIEGVPAYVITDADARHTNKRSDLRSTGELVDENGWVLRTKFYVKEAAETAYNSQIFWLRLKTIAENNNDCILFAMYMNQYRLTGSDSNILCLTDSDGYIQKTVNKGEWNNLEIAIIGNFIMVDFNGAKATYFAANGLHTDAESKDHFQLENAAMFEGNLAFGATTRTVAGESGAVANEIEKFITVSSQSVTLNVTTESGEAIIDAEDAYNALSADEKAYVTYAAKIEEAYNAYDALFADGDATENGEVDVIDFIRVKKIAAGSAKRTVKANVDKDSDKNIDAGDTVQLKKILLGVVA